MSAEPLADSFPTVERLPRGAFDHREAARLISDAFLIHASMAGRDRIDADGLAAELGDSGRLLAIRDDTGLIACAIVRPAREVQRSYERDWLEQHPNAIYYGLAGVRPDRMRQGLGERLLTAAEAYAKHEGFTEVVLSAAEDWGNDAYYRQHGYTTDDVATVGPNGEFRLHLMVKAV